VRSAGAEPLAMASTMRGDTKASRMSRRMWRSTLFLNWGLLVRTEYHPISELFAPLMAQLRAEYQRWRDKYLRRAEGGEPKLSWLRELVAKAQEPQLPSYFLGPPNHFTKQHYASGIMRPKGKPARETGNSGRRSRHGRLDAGQSRLQRCFLGVIERSL
jgi:hypothetical protein